MIKENERGGKAEEKKNNVLKQDWAMKRRQMLREKTVDEKKHEFMAFSVLKC